MSTSPSPAQQDDGLDWLREIRRTITAEFGHNPHRLGDKLREMGKLSKYAGRIVRVKKVLVPVNAAESHAASRPLRSRIGVWIGFSSKPSQC